jgi:ankyrin repeat protein
MFTAQRGHEEAAKLLLNAGADVNFISGYWTPISLAARMGNVSIVKLLTKKVRCPLFSRSAPHGAILARQTISSEADAPLADKPADVRRQNGDWDTAKGAKPLLAGANGWNALHHASRAGHREVVRYPNRRTMPSPCHPPAYSWHPLPPPNHQKN